MLIPQHTKHLVVRGPLSTFGSHLSSPITWVPGIKLSSLCLCSKYFYLLSYLVSLCVVLHCLDSVRWSLCICACVCAANN